ncbi:MAG: Wzz/FepE/Etk N-terminal domain-containing protein [bacterium]
MNFYDYWYNFKMHWWLVLLLVVLITGLAFTLTIIQPLKYRSTAQVLVGLRFQPGMETSTASKSAEYLSNLLSEVVYSGSFMKEVLKSPNITDDYGQNPMKRKKNWVRAIRTKVIGDTGIIVIDAYHQNQAQAGQLAQVVAKVLIDQSSQYHGQGNQVFVRLLDEPLTTNYPVKPNLILNVIFGFIIGWLFGLAVIYILTEIEERILASATPEEIAQADYLNSEHSAEWLND